MSTALISLIYIKYVSISMEFVTFKNQNASFVQDHRTTESLLVILLHTFFYDKLNILFSTSESDFK